MDFISTTKTAANHTAATYKYFYSGNGVCSTLKQTFFRGKCFKSVMQQTPFRGRTELNFRANSLSGRGHCPVPAMHVNPANKQVTQFIDMHVA